MYRFKGFTEKANTALNLAVEAAQELGHTYIGTEHIVLGLLREGTGVVTPKWLTFDAQNLTGTVAAMPAREDIDCPIEEHLIVELYSR